jgi:hypothetical protein
MGLKVDPKLIQAEAKSITDNANKYYSLVSGIRDSMNFLVTNSTSEGLAISAAKNQAHAHIIAIDYFEHISVEILMQYQKLVTAISNNEITEQLDEDELRALINQKQEDYHFYDSMVDNIRTIQRNFEFCSSVFDLLKSHYKSARDNALSLKKDYEKKLSNLINLEKASSSYYSSVNTMIKKQNMLLYDLSIAGAKGKFPKTKLANALSIYSAIRDHNIDSNKLLFCKDASGKKVISVEAIGLFADTEKKNMSPLQLSLYGMTVDYIFTNECNHKELKKISNAFYGDVIEGKYCYKQRKGKVTTNDFLADLKVSVEKRADANALTKDILEKYCVLDFALNIDHLSGDILIKKVNKGYEVNYSSQYEDYRSYKGGINGIHAVKSWQTATNLKQEISYIGRGVDGALNNYNDAIKEIYDYLKYNKKKLAGEAKYSICMKILEKSLEHAEGGASKVLIFPSMMKTLIDKCNDDITAERAYDRCKGIENSVIFDLHTIESSNVAEFNTKFVKGENTQMIIEHINNSTGSNITVNDIVYSQDKVSEVIDKYKKIEKTGDIGAGALYVYISKKIDLRTAKPWMQ